MRKMLRFFTVVFWIQLFVFSSVFVYGQKVKPDDVPEEVKQTLLDQQGEVKVTQWTLDGDMYVANFKVEGATAIAYIQSDGTFVRSATLIPKSTLPTLILEYINKNYPEFTIVISEIREEPDVQLYYHIEVKPEVVGASHSILTFDNAGRLLSRNDPEGFTTPEATPQQLVQEKADRKLQESNNPKGNKKPAPKTEKQEPKPKAEPKTEPKPKAEPKPKTEPKAQNNTAKTEKEENDDNGDVPAIVQKAFSKKVVQPEELVWSKVDNLYLAECKIKDQKNEFYFTPAGVWEKTYTQLPEEAITGPMLKHLNENYKGYRFITAMKETRADKQDKVLVEFYERANIKAQTSTTVIFDKLGRILKTYKPENEAPSDNYAKLNKEAITEKPNEIPTLAIDAFKLKYPKITGVEWTEDDEGYYLATYFGARGKEIVVMEGNGSMIEIRTQANIDNISANIKDYIKKNHKGYQISEYYTVRGLIDKKSYFLVIIKDKKTNMIAPLKFSTAGQIMQ